MGSATDRQVDSLSGDDLEAIFGAATALLEVDVPAINALNVFPVPDGDTGTNMLLTMRATLEEARRAQERSAGAVAAAMARGALMGARGNSGVILSQIIRGMARAAQGRAVVHARDLANALVQASEAAYKAVSKPVEGTILTVIREASAAGYGAASRKSADIVSVLEAALRSARATLARTPALLPVLRDAGVVDAGGQGLCVILEGFLHSLTGEKAARRTATQTLQAVREDWMKEAEEKTWGFCTEFFIYGHDLDVDQIREQMESMGDSTIVVGDDTAVKVHVHALQPEEVLRYAASVGTVERTKVDDIAQQQKDFATVQKEVRASVIPIAVVAVATGDGMVRVFESLHVSRVVPGGQTMNPSTGELLEAVEAVPSEKVIILPNNSNIIPAAKQVNQLTSKQVAVVPTLNMPQGVAAMVAFNPEEAFDGNLKLMETTATVIKTAEITVAVRDARIGNLSVRQGQAMGFVEGELRVVSSSRARAVRQLLKRMGVSEGTLVTIYYGGQVSQKEAQGLLRWVKRSLPGSEAELVHGGQPHYDYLISVE